MTTDFIVELSEMLEKLSRKYGVKADLVTHKLPNIIYDNDEIFENWTGNAKLEIDIIGE